MTKALPADPALAAAIRTLRQQAGLTQEHFALEAGITISALARIERGDSSPNWTSIRTIINTLGIPLHQLTTTIEAQEDPPEPAPPRAASSRAPASSYTPR